MAAILRSVRLCNILRSFSGIQKYSSGVIPLKYLKASAVTRVVNARCMSVQQTSLRSTESGRPELDIVLERLDKDVRRTGRLSRDALDEVIANLHLYRLVSPTHALLLLKCCGPLIVEENSAMRIEMVHKIWDALLKQKVPLDLSHYNGLLRVYVENDHDFSPLDFLAKLEGEQIQPNRVTYQRLIARFCQTGDIEGASKILEFMKNNNMSITENVFNSLIQGHARANDLKSSVDTLEMMEQAGLKPTAATYASLAVVQAERGDIEGINATVARSTKDDHVLDAADMLDIVYALATNGHAEHVPQMLDAATKDRYYNRDCKSIIYKLLNAGQDDVALLVYKSMPLNAETNSVAYINCGVFYLKHLVKCDRSLDSIMDTFKNIQTNNEFIIERLLETAVLHNNKLVYPLMDILQEKGRPLRAQYFFPLIYKCGNNKDVDGIYDVIRSMMSRNVPMLNSDMVDHILPILIERCKEPRETVINRILSAGLYSSELMNGLVYYYLIKNNTADAAKIVTQYNPRLRVSIHRLLSRVTLSTHAYGDIALILSKISNMRRPQIDAGEEEGEGKGDQSTYDDDVPGQFLLNLTYLSKRASYEQESLNMAALLEAMKKYGLSISQYHKSSILNNIDERAATNEVRQLLDLLASGTLRRADNGDHRSSFRRRATEVDISHMEQVLQDQIDKGYNTKNTLMNMLIYYCRANEVVKAEGTVKSLQSEHGMELGVGINVLLIDMYYSAKMIEPAMQAFKTIRELQPDALLNPAKTLKLVHLLLTESREEEALELLEVESKKYNNMQGLREDGLRDEDNRSHNMGDYMATLIMDKIAEEGSVEKVDKVSDILISNGMCSPTSRCLSAVIRIRLANDDFDGVYEKLVEFKTKHNVLPLKNIVLRKLISKEDTDNLQKVLDLGSDVHGETNSLLDLAVAFSEEGRIKQSKKIMQTPGLRFSNSRFHFRFDNYLQVGNIEYMENLMASTVDCLWMDRAQFYRYLLEAYKNVADDGEKSLELWTRMQEENLAIPDTFLYDLGNYLTSLEKPVPFTIPEAPSTVSNRRPQRISNPSSLVAEPKIVHPELSVLRSLLQKELVRESLQQYNKLQDDPDVVVTHRDMSDLFSLLLKDGQVDDIIAVCKKRNLTARNFDRMMPLRNLLVDLSEKGDFDTIQSIFGDKRALENSFFFRKMSEAAVNCKRGDEIFNKLESWLEVEQGDKSRIQLAYVKSPLLWVLYNDQSLLPKMEKFAESNEASGLLDGKSILWAYHFYKGDTEKATALRQQLNTANHEFQHLMLCYLMRRNMDTALAPRLVEEIQKMPENIVNPAALSNVFSTWIDILRLQDKPEEALQVLDTAVKHTPLSSLNEPGINRLREALAAKNITFPYGAAADQVGSAARATSSSSSSSDSD